MFGAIVCPKCGYPRGVKLSIKKSKCPRCGSINDIRLIRIYSIAEGEREIGEVVRTMAVQIRRNECHQPDFDIDGDVRTTIAMAATRLGRGSPTKEEIDNIAIQIIRDYGFFSLHGLEMVLHERYPRYADRIMEVLRKEEQAVEGGSEKEAKKLPKDKALAAIQSLSERQGDFSSQDLAAELDLKDRERLQTLIAKLLEAGEITEVRLGRYRGIQL